MGALSTVSILDLTDERGIYGAKLLADLGASVVRVEPPDGDPLRGRGPHLEGAPQGTSSLWYLFFATNRKICNIDLSTSEGRSELVALADKVDILLTCPGTYGAVALDMEELLRRRPEVIVIDTSSFGPDGPWADYLAPDLVAGALAGAVATTGDVDTPPLKCFGDLNFMISGAYSAIAALSALHARRDTGLGQRADVSVHETIASCLEHVLLWYWYAPLRPTRPERTLPRRGSLHWSNAYQILAAKDGAIMVTPTPDMQAHLDWLEEVGYIDDLRDPSYMVPENLHNFVNRLMEQTTKWVATRDVESLFHEAQSRHAPYGWVQTIEQVAHNPQLEARQWWTNYQHADRQIKGPGTPYWFSDTPWRAEPAESVTTGEALSSFPEKTPQNPPTASTPAESPGILSDRKPLSGLRVLDFSHVLAGPFCTRLLGDMGADVVRVNSELRATGANDPNTSYYVSFNRNKRSLALNMALEGSRPIARALAEKADIIINNFSPGVLDRWGMGYDVVSKGNPGVILLEMSGMGSGGPWSDFVTYAPTLHALSGLSHLTSVPGREDIGIGYSYNDHQAGLHGAVAILAALESRRQTGRGQRIDLSQFELAVNLLGPTLMDLSANGNAAGPVGNALPYDAAAPHGCYRCKDRAVDAAEERWVAIACMNDTQWQALRGVMGDPEWARAPGLDTASGRLAATDLDERLTAWTRGENAEDVMTKCQAAGVPAGVVQSGADLFESDPQLSHAGFLNETDSAHPVLGSTFFDSLAIHFRDMPCDDYPRSRVLGEDSMEVLQEWLGMDDEEIVEAAVGLLLS
jgi:crotonobetainyl-CoA:carnitine CoA-transferase CaiB-like acyl-CoA transferase